MGCHWRSVDGTAEERIAQSLLKRPSRSEVSTWEETLLTKAEKREGRTGPVAVPHR